MCIHLNSVTLWMFLKNLRGEESFTTLCYILGNKRYCTTHTVPWKCISPLSDFLYFCIFRILNVIRMQCWGFAWHNGTHVIYEVILLTYLSIEHSSKSLEDHPGDSQVEGTMISALYQNSTGECQAIRLWAEPEAQLRHAASCCVMHQITLSIQWCRRRWLPF